MENVENLDTYVVDVRAGIVKTKLIIWSAAALVILSIIVSSFISLHYSSKAIEEIRIIDRAGYSYTSAIVDPREATELQIRAFLLNFCKLCYGFDKNNIEHNLNRALALGDETVAGYIELHQQPNDIYQAVKGLGRVAEVNEAEIINNLRLLDNSFTLMFVQQLKGSSESQYHVTITGKVIYITPSTIDNPNGFFIINYTETYQQLR